MSEPNIARNDCVPHESLHPPIPLETWPRAKRGLTLRIPPYLVPFRAGYFCRAHHFHGPDTACVDGLHFLWVQPVGRSLVACHAVHGRTLYVSLVSTKTASVHKQVSITTEEQDEWVDYLRARTWAIATAEAARDALVRGYRLPRVGKRPALSLQQMRDGETWLRKQLATLGNGNDEGGAA